MKARKPLLEAAVVGVDIVDMQVRPRGDRLSRGRNGVKGDVRLAGKGCQRFAPIADQGLCGLTTPANAVAIEALSSCGRRCRRSLPSGRGRQAWGCCPGEAPDGGLFRRVCAPCAADRTIGPRRIRRMKVSSASTMPLSVRGLSAAGAPKNRWRQRKAVVGWTPQSSAVFARLLPSIIARAWSSQRSLLRRCAIGVLVSALKIRPQLLQRNRASPRERPQAMISRPAQWGQPRASTVNRRPKLDADWSGPLGPDSDQAADLTMGRGLRSSNC